MSSRAKRRNGARRESIVGRQELLTRARAVLGAFEIQALESRQLLSGSGQPGEIVLPGANSATAIALQPDGKVLVASKADDGGATLSRLTTSGQLDPTFDTDGNLDLDFGANTDIRALAIDPNDPQYIYAAGSAGNDFVLARRLLSTGAPDSHFGGGGVVTLDIDNGARDAANAIALQGGVVYLAGSTETSGGQTMSVARYNLGAAVPAFDLKFAIDSATSHDLVANAILVDGSTIYLGGASTAFDPLWGTFQSSFAFAKCSVTSDANGVPQANVGPVSITAFEDEILEPVNARIFSLRLQSGEVLALGGAGYGPALARYKSDGTVDTSFGSSGTMTVQVANFTPFGGTVIADPGAGTESVLFGGVHIGDDGKMRLGAVELNSGYVAGDFHDSEAAVASAEEAQVAITFGADGSFAGAGPIYNGSDRDIIVGANWTASINGPDTGVRGFLMHFSVADLIPDAQSAWQVFGPSSVPPGLGAEFDWIPDSSGSYTIVFTGTDADGATQTLTKQVTVGSSGVVDGTLQIGGSAGANAVGVVLVDGKYVVTIDGDPVATYGFDTVTRVVAYGGAGDDQIILGGNVSVDAELYGGEGNDFLVGGIKDDVLFGGDGIDQLMGRAGNDIFVGGDGADKLLGGTGRDVLIGGGGADRIHGNQEDDILIAGSISNLSVPLADFCAGLLKAPIDDVGELLNGHVSDDGVADTLSGNAGQDWFFFNSTEDKVTDYRAEDFPLLAGLV